MQRNFNLDIIRAIAILMVVVYHTMQMTVLDDSINRYTTIGKYGVDIFFCLSGYLIGTLYFKEYIKTGKVNILQFWLRRWSRTVPMYFLFLGVSFLSVHLARKEPFNVSYLFFMQNYLTEIPFFLTSWSLCIEEHFYVLMPVILTILLAFLGKNKTLLVLFCAVFILFPLLLRVFEIWNVGLNAPFGYHFTATHLRADGLLLGVLFAYLQMYKVRVWLPKPAYVYGISAVVLVASIYVDATLYYILGYFLIALSVSAAIFLAKNKPSYLTKGKAARLIYLISVSSYSLYLTHPLMIHLSLWFLKKMHIEQSAVRFCFTFLLALAIGFLTYALVEKPILKWREKYVPTT